MENKKKILLIDNYDSFTYNLVQYFQILQVEVIVVRNNHHRIDFEPHYLVIGPGPGSPKDSGNSIPHIEKFAGKIPILGICLGHQCIAKLYGGKIIKANSPMHGKVSKIQHTQDGIFTGIPKDFSATRYHSLVIDPKTLPSSFKITAMTQEGEIMAIEHRSLPIFGIQFHPESIMTKQGINLLMNFLKIDCGYAIET